jgi:hypothetical protein
MRHLFAALLAVVLIAGAATWVRAADEKAASSDKKTIEGELVDMHCWAKGEKHGEGHAACAKKCLSGDDGKAGVVTDGKAITIDTAAKPLADYAAKTVRVTGAVDADNKTIKPDKVEVKEGDDWKEISLKAAE